MNLAMLLPVKPARSLKSGLWAMKRRLMNMGVLATALSGKSGGISGVRFADLPPHQTTEGLMLHGAGGLGLRFISRGKNQPCPNLNE